MPTAIHDVLVTRDERKQAVSERVCVYGPYINEVLFLRY